MNSRQPQFDRIISFYESAEAESKMLPVIVPEEVRQKVQKLSADWLKLRSLTSSEVEDVGFAFEKEIGKCINCVEIPQTFFCVRVFMFN